MKKELNRRVYLDPGTGEWAEREIDTSEDPPTIFLVLGILYIASYLALFGLATWMLLRHILGLN